MSLCRVMSVFVLTFKGQEMGVFTIVGLVDEELLPRFRIAEGVGDVLGWLALAVAVAPQFLGCGWQEGTSRRRSR